MLAMRNRVVAPPANTSEFSGGFRFAARNTDMSSDPDLALSGLLRRADPVGRIVPLPAGEFAGAVHRRIRSASPSAASGGLLRRLGLSSELLPFAAGLALVGALAGGGLAYAGQRAAAASLHASAYARSIDPWLMHEPAPAGAR
jgi:hypothetical protein